MSTPEVLGPTPPPLGPGKDTGPRMETYPTAKLPQSPAQLHATLEPLLMAVKEKELSKEAAIELFKSHIHNMRQHLPELLESKGSTEEMTSFVANSYRALISSAATYAEMTLASKGKTCPVSYCLGGLGSLARGDVSPYSDLDLVLIVAEDQPDTRQYFEELLGIMREMIKGLGEGGQKGGIQFCSEGLTPPYQKLESKRKEIGGSPQLYGTPEQIAESAVKAYTNREISNPKAPPGAINIGLQMVGFLHGDKAVLQRFVAERQKLYKQPAEGSENKTIRQEKGLEYMGAGFSNLRELDLLEKALAEDKGFVDIKKLILRPITVTISGLAIYHGIEKTNTLECIKELVDKKLLNPRLADKLIEVFSLGTRLRYKAQLAALREEDKASLSEAASKVYQLTPKEKEELKEGQRVLFGLRDAQRKFMEEKGDSKAFI